MVFVSHLITFCTLQTLQSTYKKYFRDTIQILTQSRVIIRKLKLVKLMKKAEHKSSTDTARTKTQTNTESLQPEIIPDLQAITPENIVYLQRTIGNQATLRLLQRQQSPVKSRTSKPVVQRADTGLRDGGTSGDVATAVHAFASDPANAEKHPREIIPVLMGAINGKLTSLGVFPNSCRRK